MTDLRTLIDVSAGTRLPQYEPEIFSDTDLTRYYLHRLCCGEWWYDHDDSAPRMVFRYAWHVMNCRWPEADSIIATHPAWACSYAVHVMNSRWPEAEQVISADRNYRKLYNRYFGTRI